MAKNLPKLTETLATELQKSAEVWDCASEIKASLTLTATQKDDTARKIRVSVGIEINPEDAENDDD